MVGARTGSGSTFYRYVPANVVAYANMARALLVLRVKESSVRKQTSIDKTNTQTSCYLHRSSLKRCVRTDQISRTFSRYSV